MRTHGPLLLLLLGLVVVIQGCRRDPDLRDDWTGGTPYHLDLPPWSMGPATVLNIPFDEPLTVEGVALGRKLFYEKALSNDHSMSCATCHNQENAFSDPRPFSIGTDGSIGRRNSMAVMNAVFDKSFFWDSRAPTLEIQAFAPVVDHAEMRNTWPVVTDRLQAHQEYPSLFKKAFGSDQIDSTRVVAALAQFERTLISFNSRFDRFQYHGDQLALTPQEQRGLELFMNEAFCGGCHIPPLFTDHEARNNGLDQFPLDEGLGEVTGAREHNGLFKTTSLRNIAVTAPYMHDARFETLEEVLDFYAEGVQANSENLDIHMQPYVMGSVQLSQEDRADIVAFLHSLTDPGFLSNPAFSDPH